MAESIVKVPKNNTLDYDFIAFSFRGKHSYEDFGLYRTSGGNRYKEDLSPTLTDKTAEASGQDGMYFFNAFHKQKVFNINFAFDSMDDNQLRELKSWLNGKELGDLWFAECPYKVYTAKVTGQPTMNFVPFDDSVRGRVYKGDGTIQFTCYWPYAHTPDYIEDLNGRLLDGNYYTSYSHFSNYESLLKTGMLPGQSNNEFGDLPFHFVAHLDDIEQERTIKMVTDNEGISYYIEDKNLSSDANDYSGIVEIE